MEKNEKSEKDTTDLEAVNEFLESKQNIEVFSNVPEKAFALMDSFIENIEKKQKKRNTEAIIEKAEKIPKVSKTKRKISKVETERPLKKDDMEIFPSTTLKDSYSEGLISAFIFVNPFLQAKGIEPIKDSEIKDLVYAIFELFEGNIKKIIKNTETNISFIRNIKKILNLGKAFWNIIGSRIGKIRDSLIKLRAKRETEKLTKLAKQKVDKNAP